MAQQLHHLARAVELDKVGGTSSVWSTCPAHQLEPGTQRRQPIPNLRHMQTGSDVVGAPEDHLAPGQRPEHIFVWDGTVSGDEPQHRVLRSREERQRGSGLLARHNNHAAVGRHAACPSEYP